MVGILFLCLNQSAAPDITEAARVCACRNRNQEPDTPSCKAALAGRGFSMLTTSQELFCSPSLPFPCRKPILFIQLSFSFVYNEFSELCGWQRVKKVTCKTKHPKHLPDFPVAKHSLNPAELADHKIALSARLNTCLGPKNAAWQDWAEGHCGNKAAGTQSPRLDNEFYHCWPCASREGAVGRQWLHNERWNAVVQEEERRYETSLHLPVKPDANGSNVQQSVCGDAADDVSSLSKETPETSEWVINGPNKDLSL